MPIDPKMLERAREAAAAEDAEDAAKAEKMKGWYESPECKKVFDDKEADDS